METFSPNDINTFRVVYPTGGQQRKEPFESEPVFYC